MAEKTNQKIKVFIFRVSKDLRTLGIELGLLFIFQSYYKEGLWTSSLTKRILVQCWCIFTLTSSARCHSITHSQVRMKMVQKNQKKLGLLSQGCPVRPLTVGPTSPGGSASAPKKTREQRVHKLNFSSHTGLSGALSAQWLAVRTSRWSRPLAHR